jgi:phage-related protein
MPKIAYLARSIRPPKPVHWIGSSLQDVRAFPEAVQDVVGYALFVAQCGDQHPAAKRLKGDLRGLVEIVDDWDGDTYRAVYTTRMEGVVYVLHAFQKKATKGIATPRYVIDVIKDRYRRARAHHEVHPPGEE